MFLFKSEYDSLSTWFVAWPLSLSGISSMGGLESRELVEMLDSCLQRLHLQRLPLRTCVVSLVPAHDED